MACHFATSGATKVLPAPVSVPICRAELAPARLVQAVSATAMTPSTARTAAVARFLFTLFSPLLMYCPCPERALLPAPHGLKCGFELVTIR